MTKEYRAELRSVSRTLGRLNREHDKIKQKLARDLARQELATSRTIVRVRKAADAEFKKTIRSSAKLVRGIKRAMDTAEKRKLILEGRLSQ